MLAPDTYAEKYVVFLDLLGFKDKVEAADGNPVMRQELLNALDIIRDSLCTYDAVGMRLTHFSDCIIFSANRSQEGLEEILHSINVLTFNLLNYDFFVRGGLAVGGVHHDHNFVYGLAVNKAYEIESKEAVFPMTMVSDEVLSDIKEYGSPFEESLTQDADGRYFVHYLKLFSDYSPEPLYAGKIMLDKPGQRIVNFICHRLKEHTDPNVLKKDRWFQSYWNSTVAIKGVFSRIEEGVAGSDLEYGPCRIARRILSENG